jgi:hypothetical protein
VKRRPFAFSLRGNAQAGTARLNIDTIKCYESTVVRLLASLRDHAAYLFHRLNA